MLGRLDACIQRRELFTDPVLSLIVNTAHHGTWLTSQIWKQLPCSYDLWVYIFYKPGKGLGLNGFPIGRASSLSLQPYRVKWLLAYLEILKRNGRLLTLTKFVNILTHKGGPLAPLLTRWQTALGTYRLLLRPFSHCMPSSGLTSTTRQLILIISDKWKGSSQHMYHISIISAASHSKRRDYI